MNRITVGTLLALCVAGSAWAQDDKRVVVSLAGVFSDQVREVDDRNNSVNVGGGALVEWTFNDNISLESGALVVNRQYDVVNGDQELITEVRRVHVPLLARLWLSDYFSVAAGPFIAFRSGDTNTARSLNGAENSLSTSVDDPTEWGFDGAITLNLAVNERTGMFLEGRYTALMDLPDEEEADQISGLAGFKFDL